MRLSELAEMIAPHLNRTAAWAHNALRNPAMKDYLLGIPGPTPKSPASYPFIEQVRAFVLLVAQANNLSASEIAIVDEALNASGAELMDTPGGEIPTGLQSLIASVEAGNRDWHLAIRYILRPDGEREIVAHLGRGEMKAYGQRAANAERMTSGALTLGHNFIPLGDLLAPLFNASSKG